MNKYHVSTPERRTDADGRLFASRAEMLYDQALRLDPDIAWVLRQVPVWLTPDDKTVVDFLVGTLQCAETQYCPRLVSVEAHEVKGMETPAFRRIKKLWKKYAPFPMRVVKKSYKSFVTSELIEPEQ